MKKFFILFFAVLLGVGALSTGPNAWATSYDPTGVAGNFPVPPATPMIWNQGGVGDALFGEMYRAVLGTINEPFNFATYVSIENVSTYWVAAHVRLRAGRYSIEVWDRIILLSPRDVFWFQFQVSEGADHLQVQIFSADTKTLRYSGLIGATDTTYTALLDPDLIRQFKITWPNPQDPALWEEMTQGYIEVIGLFALPGSINGYGFPTDKTAPWLMSALWGDNGAQVCYNTSGATDPSNVGVLYGADPTSKACALDVQKYLTGHVFMGDFTNGIYMGYPMRAVKDFRYQGEDVAYRDCAIRNNNSYQCFNGANKAYNNALILYTAFGTDAAYTEPDWATSFGPTWNDGSDYFDDGFYATDSFSLDDFEDAFIKQYVFADYFNGGFSYVPGDASSGTFTMAALTFPTKYLHYFYDCDSGLFDRINGICAVDIVFPNPRSCYNGYTDCWPVGFEDKGAGIRAKLDLGYFIDAVGLSAGIWDLEEKPAGSGSPFKTISLPWEANFVPFGNLSLEKLAPICFLTVDTPYTPFGEAVYPTWNAGWWLMNSFQLINDPRWSAGCSYTGFCPEYFPLLGYGGSTKLPISGQVMDFEFTNFSHARMYEPSWDNPTFNPTAGNICSQVSIDPRYPWYGGFCGD